MAHYGKAGASSGISQRNKRLLVTQGGQCSCGKPLNAGNLFVGDKELLRGACAIKRR